MAVVSVRVFEIPSALVMLPPTMSTEPTSLTARPKPAKIAVAIPYRASFRTTRAASRRACRRARARRRGRRRHPGDGREADRRDRRRREYELRHDHRLSGEDELKRPERSLIRDREQDQEADDHAGNPIPVLTTDFTTRLPGNSENPTTTATGTLNSVLSATAVTLTYSET